MRRAVSSYAWGSGGICTSLGIHAQNKADVATGQLPELSDQMLSAAFSIVNGQMYLFGIELDQVVSVTLGAVSLIAVLIRGVSDLDMWLYKRKLKKMEESLMQEKK